MNLVFIAGSLEPVKDGVADYTHPLAAMLASMGHRCLCIACNDPFVGGKGPAGIPRVNEAPETQVSNLQGSANALIAHSMGAKTPLTVVRLPATATWRQRRDQAKEFLLSCGYDLRAIDVGEFHATPL